VVAGAEAFEPIDGFSSCGPADEFLTTNKARNSSVTGRNRENMEKPPFRLLYCFCDSADTRNYIRPEMQKRRNPKGLPGANEDAGFSLCLAKTPA
jgi:hypothetical protein